MSYNTHNEWFLQTGKIKTNAFKAKNCTFPTYGNTKTNLSMNWPYLVLLILYKMNQC